MPASQEMQEQRFERKYLLPASLKEPVREFVSFYLAQDRYSAAAPDHAYAIHSIYLDSAGLHTAMATRNGQRNRFKLRLRYYEDHPGAPVFLEVKRRHDEVLCKQRCKVPAAAAQNAIMGDSGFVEDCDMAAFHTFCDLRDSLDATPRAHVAYSREAWVSPGDNSVRVTLDQDVRVEPKFDTLPTSRMDHPARPFGARMVLELKYTNRFPEWCRELVETFDLMQSGAAKYTMGVEKYGDEWFKSEAASWFGGA